MKFPKFSTMRKIGLLVLISFIIYVVYISYKNTEDFIINVSQKPPNIRLDTDGPISDPFSRIYIKVHGEVSNDGYIVFNRDDIIEPEHILPSYRIKLKKGIVDTVYQGDWYTNKARLSIFFPPNSKGMLKGYIRINN
jgi:hypothetical protein